MYGALDAGRLAFTEWTSLNSLVRVSFQAQANFAELATEWAVVRFTVNADHLADGIPFPSKVFMFHHQWFPVMRQSRIGLASPTLLVFGIR